MTSATAAEEETGDSSIIINEWVDDYWYHENGRNVIPANSKMKKPLEPWEVWQDKPQPKELIEKWKAEGRFKQGIAIIMGQSWRGPNEGIDLCSIDTDNLKAIEEFCTRNNKKMSVDEFAEKTVVEQHIDNLNKAHFYVFCKGKALVDKSPTANLQDDKPKIEVKGSNKCLMYVTPSYHKGGCKYQITGTKKVIVLEPEQVDALQNHLYSICAKYGIEYKNKKTINITNTNNTTTTTLLTDDQIKQTSEMLQNYYVKDSRDLFVFYFSGFACKEGIHIESTVDPK